MNFERIRSAIDVDAMQEKHATVVGGAYGLAADLVRCGLGAITLVDYDRIAASNPARQDLNLSDLGLYKIKATAVHLQRINPEVEIDLQARDLCAMSRDEFDAVFGHTDLFVFATDFFPAQARGNQEAVRLGKPSVSVGLYQAARAGEIVWAIPGRTACYRCVCARRYEAFRSGGASITSVGGTILDIHLLDAIAGYIAVGLLTQGADNRLGRLIEQLDTRTLLQVKIDPDYRLGEKDIFGQHLGTSPANFSFTTIALPMERDPRCPDCSGIWRSAQAPPSPPPATDDRDGEPCSPHEPSPSSYLPSEPGDAAQQVETTTTRRLDRPCDAS